MVARSRLPRIPSRSTSGSQFRSAGNTDVRTEAHCNRLRITVAPCARFAPVSRPFLPFRAPGPDRIHAPVIINEAALGELRGIPDGD